MKFCDVVSRGSLCFDHSMASKTVEGFDYPEFRRQLGAAGLDRKQTEFLTQRLDLLESFLDLEGSIESPNFTAGEITIIDLSCPFMDASTACVLFKVGMGLYLESDSNRTHSPSAIQSPG